MRITFIPVSQGETPGSRRAGAKVVSKTFGSDVLWFDLPESYAENLYPCAEAWVQAFLPLAMRRHESIEIDAELEAGWLENAQKWMAIWAGWDSTLRPVTIHPSGTRNALRASDRIGLFFTGGIDSIYSLLYHDQSASANFVPRWIDDLIYVSGFDIPRRNQAALKEKLAALAEVARSQNKNLVSITTNLRETRLKELDWGAILHGPALGAVGLLLQRRLGTVLISAGGNINDQTSWGSHPLTDPLMSSSAVQIIRYQNNVNRFLKTEFIAKSPAMLNHLRVCWVRESHDNCGACEKCIRTMLMLEVLGVLEQTKCFPPGSVLEKLKTVQITNPLAVPLWEDVKTPALDRGRKDIADAIDDCLARSRKLIAARKEPGLLRQLERRLRHARKAFFH